MNVETCKRSKLIPLFSIILAIGSFGPLLCADDKDLDAGMIVHHNLMKWEEALQKLESKFGLTFDDYAVIVSIPEQELRLVRGEETVRLYKISTSKNGAGNRAGSRRTPLGTHCIAAKIGKGAKFGSIFNARQNTGRTAQISTDNVDTRKDQKTSRILWLKGMELGVNRGTGIDTFSRLIYIHGTPEEGLIGTPASKGCIRMKNGDVIELFDLVQEGTLVEIYN